jgi:Uma2 family endonuclease
MARPPAIETDTTLRLVLNVQSVRLTDDQFFRFCSDNRDFRIEMSAQGELIIMSPTNPETGRKTAIITRRLGNWAELDGSGECFDSNSEFTLPNGAKRSPDASWILKSRWNRLTIEEKNRFSRICPDFVIELRSPSDRSVDLEENVEEYIANGTQLGWLLDPVDNRAVIYRSSQSAQVIEKPGILSGDPLLPGFRFDFAEIL